MRLDNKGPQLNVSGLNGENIVKFIKDELDMRGESKGGLTYVSCISRHEEGRKICGPHLCSGLEISIKLFLTLSVEEISQ